MHVQPFFYHVRQVGLCQRIGEVAKHSSCTIELLVLCLSINDNNNYKCRSLRVSHISSGGTRILILLNRRAPHVPIRTPECSARLEAWKRLLKKQTCVTPYHARRHAVLPKTFLSPELVFGFNFVRVTASNVMHSLLNYWLLGGAESRC